MKRFNNHLPAALLLALSLAACPAAVFADGVYFGAGFYESRASIDDFDDDDDSLALMLGYKFIDFECVHAVRGAGLLRSR